MNDKELMPPPMAPVRAKQKVAPPKPDTTTDTIPKTAYGLQFPVPKSNQSTTETTETTEAPQPQTSNDSISDPPQSVISEPKQPSVELQYKPPFWSAPLPHSLWLEVLKNGSIVEKIDIGSKDYFLIGRLPICDLPLDHQSISRQHAVIQNRDTGETFLYDLGSTHGTMVNKRPIKGKSYFPLRIGDVVRFGQSTRLFVVGGPEEIEKDQQQLATKRREEALKRKMEEATNIRTYTPLIELFSKSNSGMPIMQNDSVTWGIDMDDDAIYEHEKSEQEELFAGNEDDAEAFLKHEKKVHRSEQRRHKQMVEDDDSSGDDEFYDRTKKKSEFLTGEKVETYSSLVAAKAALEEKKSALMRKLRETGNTAAAEDGEDSLDAFMNSNTQSMLEESRKKIKNEIAQLEKEGDRITRLINIAAPALKPLNSEKPSLSTSSAEPKKENIKQVFSTADDKKQENGIKQKHLLSDDIPSEFRVQSDRQERNEEKENENENESTGSNPPEDAPELSSEPASSSELHDKKAGKRGRRERQKEKEKEHQKRKKIEEYESKYEAWVPPVNQTGDGRTTLNEKLGY